MRFTRVFLIIAAVAAIAVPVALGMGFDDTKPDPPQGSVGTPYSYQFSARSGCPPYEFVITNGSLPPGLSMSSSGLVTGTPTVGGSSSFWVEVRDHGCPPCDPFSCSGPSQRPFSISIVGKLTVTTASPLAPGTVGVPYSTKLTSDSGAPQTWSIVSGSLPPGLGLAADGTISGTPTAATPAPASFAVKVNDGSRTDTKTLTLDVVAPLAVAATPPPTAEVGHELTPTTFTATGGRGPYAWSLVGAPAWLTIDPASGAISGTPTAAGSFSLQVSAKDAYGKTATTNLGVVVKARVTVKTARLPLTKVGKLFRVTLRTAGGVGPFTWKASGKLPVGLRFNRKTGVLSGAARKAGKFRLRFAVTDSFGVSSAKSLVLTVK
jgi:large repetitive protein